MLGQLKQQANRPTCTDKDDSRSKKGIKATRCLDTSDTKWPLIDDPFPLLFHARSGDSSTSSRLTLFPTLTVMSYAQCSYAFSSPSSTRLLSATGYRYRVFYIPGRWHALDSTNPRQFLPGEQWLPLFLVIPSNNVMPPPTQYHRLCHWHHRLLKQPHHGRL